MDQGLVDYLMQNDLRSFVTRAFEVLHPGLDLEDSWAIDAIVHTLSEVAGGACRRQIINMPPRSLKSIIVSVALPAYLLGQDPSTKIIVTSYSDELAVDLSNKTRRLMESDFYRRIFPKTRLVRSRQNGLETEEGGMRYATSIGGSLTGFGADILIVDDPHNAVDIASKVARDRVWEFFRSALQSRLDDPSTGAIIVVQQRLHDDDLTGHLLERGGYDLLKLQAVATEACDIRTGALTVKEVQAGTLLYPKRLPLEILDQLKADMGAAAYEAQFQQEPTPADGVVIRRSWLQYGSTPPIGDRRVTLSFDTALKTNPANDYSVCTVWLEIQGKHYLIDVWRDRVEFPDLQAQVLRLAELYKPRAILIEDQGSGSSLVQTLRQSNWPVIPLRARDSKEVRLAGVSTYFESGKVILPSEAAWLAAFEAELLAFPSARFDDQVDSVSQYLSWIHERPKPIFEYDSGLEVSGPDHQHLAEILAMLRPGRR